LHNALDWNSSALCAADCRATDKFKKDRVRKIRAYLISNFVWLDDKIRLTRTIYRFKESPRASYAAATTISECKKGRTP
jgi:hypothetical protein